MIEGVTCGLDARVFCWCAKTTEGRRRFWPAASAGMRFSSWLDTYFNYFTEIEEHFRRARGTGLFLLSPLDWALIEAWKNAGIPLEAVLRGIDAAFEKWRKRRRGRGCRW